MAAELCNGVLLVHFCATLIIDNIILVINMTCESFCRQTEGVT